MTSVTSHLFYRIKEYVETGRINTIDNMENEVKAVIARLQHRQTLNEPGPIDDLIEKLLLEIASFRKKAAEYESLLTEVKSYAETLRQERNQVIACGMELYELAQAQLKENPITITASETMKKSNTTAPHPSLTPGPSSIDPTVRPALSRTAVVSFPGGPRTITIHPPGSPSYRSIVRDEKGDIIIDFKNTKPLRREGAFRGSLDDIDWDRITRVYGRGPEPGGSRSAPPIPFWPDRSQLSSSPQSPSRCASDIIARQRQLSFSMQTDRFGRLLARDHLIKAESPWLPSNATSSASPSQDASRSEPEAASTPASMPPSPSLVRGKKRPLYVEEDEDEKVPPKTCDSGAEDAPQAAKEPTAPTPLPERSESRAPDSEGPSKRKKRRSEEVTLVGGTLSRSNSARPN